MQRIYIYTGNRPVAGNGDSKYKSYVEEGFIQKFIPIMKIKNNQKLFNPLRKFLARPLARIYCDVNLKNSPRIRGESCSIT